MGRTGERTTLHVFALVLALLACKKGEESSGSSSKGPIFTKPFAELAQAEVGGACEKLGWSNSGVTSSSGAGSSNIIASCTKESPDGTPSPDGKKRLRMAIGVYKDPANEVAGRKSYVDGQGGVSETQGTTTLTVVIYDKPKAEAQKTLNALLGK